MEEILTSDNTTTGIFYIKNEVKQEPIYVLQSKLIDYCKGKLKNEKTRIACDESGFNYNNQDNILRFLFDNIPLVHRIHRNYSLSCGHRQFTDLSPNSEYKRIRALFKDEYRENVLQDIYQIIFDYCKEVLKAQFILCSNNNKHYNLIMNNTLDKLKRWDTGWEFNPNSENTIKIWVI